MNALQAHSNSNNTSNNNGVLFVSFNWKIVHLFRIFSVNLQLIFSITFLQQDHQNLIKEKDAQLSEYQKQINSLKSEVDELKKKNVVVVVSIPL